MNDAVHPLLEYSIHYWNTATQAICKIAKCQFSETQKVGRSLGPLESRGTQIELRNVGSAEH
jgi:hypothetical protein